jgi:hypothetical protein
MPLTFLPPEEINDSLIPPPPPLQQEDDEMENYIPPPSDTSNWEGNTVFQKNVPQQISQIKNSPMLSSPPQIREIAGIYYYYFILFFLFRCDTIT